MVPRKRGERKESRLQVGAIDAGDQGIGRGFVLEPLGQRLLEGPQARLDAGDDVSSGDEFYATDWRRRQASRGGRQPHLGPRLGGRHRPL